MAHNVVRDGKMYVMSERCSTCIFRPGNLMHLQRGRVRAMVDEVQRTQGCIPCHKTLGGDNAICRGQFDLHPTQPIQIAERLGMVVYVELDTIPEDV
jgi:hypothetical protein